MSCENCCYLYADDGAFPMNNGRPYCHWEDRPNLYAPCEEVEDSYSYEDLGNDWW